jgi:hypothetical protein
MTGLAAEYRSTGFWHKAMDTRQFLAEKTSCQQTRQKKHINSSKSKTKITFTFFFMDVIIYFPFAVRRFGLYAIRCQHVTASGWQMFCRAVHLHVPALTLA